VSHRVAVPMQLLSGKGHHYALEVKGDSMIDAGINDGDIVVIREGLDGRERRHRRGAGRGAGGDAEAVPPQGLVIALEAANPAYETRVYRDDQVIVQGRLVGLIRSY
jgi:repressor LexA